MVVVYSRLWFREQRDLLSSHRGPTQRRGYRLRCTAAASTSQRLSEEEEELESGPELLLVELNRGVRPLERLLGTEWRDERMGDGP